MDRRQHYALTHPLDEFHMHRLEACKRQRHRAAPATHEWVTTR